MIVFLILPGGHHITMKAIDNFNALPKPVFVIVKLADNELHRSIDYYVTMTHGANDTRYGFIVTCYPDAIAAGYQIVEHAEFDAQCRIPQTVVHGYDRYGVRTQSMPSMTWYGAPAVINQVADRLQLHYYFLILNEPLHKGIRARTLTLYIMLHLWTTRGPFVKDCSRPLGEISERMTPLDKLDDDGCIYKQRCDIHDFSAATSVLSLYDMINNV